MEQGVDRSSNAAAAELSTLHGQIAELQEQRRADKILLQQMALKASLEKRIEQLRAMESMKAEQVRKDAAVQHKIELMAVQRQIDNASLRAEMNANEARLKAEMGFKEVQRQLEQERQERRALQQQVQELQLVQRVAAMPQPSRHNFLLDQPQLLQPFSTVTSASRPLQAAEHSEGDQQLILQQRVTIADMQRQLQLEQQQAERWRQEAAEKEAAIARKEANMQHELEARQEALVAAEMKAGQKPEPQREQTGEPHKPAPAPPALAPASSAPASTTRAKAAPAPSAALAPASSAPLPKSKPVSSTRAKAALPEGMQHHFVSEI